MCDNNAVINVHRLLNIIKVVLVSRLETYSSFFVYFAVDFPAKKVVGPRIVVSIKNI